LTISKIILSFIAHILIKKIVKGKLRLYSSIRALRHEEVWGGGGIHPRFLDRRLLEVSGELHAPAISPSGKILDRRLDGAQNRCARHGEEKNLTPIAMRECKLKNADLLNKRRAG
jgi:hypothetical protein